MSDYIVKFADESDFDDLYSIAKKNTKLLGPIMPIEIRQRLAKKHIIALYDNNKAIGFAMLNVLQRIMQVTIYSFVVHQDYRGLKLGRFLFDSICEQYNDRIVICKCIKDSSSELFWRSVSVKVGEEKGKKQPLSVFAKRGRNYIDVFNVSSDK